MIDEASYLSLCGWKGVDAIQQAFASQFPTLVQAAPHLMAAPDADGANPPLQGLAGRAG